MIFSGIHSQFAEFKFYGFDDTPVPNDIYALRIRLFVNVRAFMGWWQAESNPITTEEAWKLQQWLKDLATPGAAAAHCLYFNEPDLSFYVLQKRATGTVLRIDFNYDLRPEDADTCQQYYITLCLTDAELEELAARLSRELCTLLECDERIAEREAA